MRGAAMGAIVKRECPSLIGRRACVFRCARIQRISARLPERSSRVDDHPTVRWAMKCAAMGAIAKARERHSPIGGRGVCRCARIQRISARLPVRLSRMDDRPAVWWATKCAAMGCNRESARTAFPHRRTRRFRCARIQRISACLPVRSSRMDDRPAVRYMLNRESTFNVPQIMRGARGAGYAASRLQSRKRAQRHSPSADTAFPMRSNTAHFRVPACALILHG